MSKRKHPMTVHAEKHALMRERSRLLAERMALQLEVQRNAEAEAAEIRGFAQQLPQPPERP